MSHGCSNLLIERETKTPAPFAHTMWTSFKVVFPNQMHSTQRGAAFPIDPVRMYAMMRSPKMQTLPV